MNESHPTPPLRVGLVLNPWAGIGGPAGLRGSDGEVTRARALERGSAPLAAGRGRRFLAALGPDVARAEWLTWAGDMGGDLLREAGIDARACGTPAGSPSRGMDTIEAARTLVEEGISLLLFVGGDGTARDVCAAISTRVPVLGIPAGVKMYSGVFAVSPESAADIVRRLMDGVPAPLEAADVRDIDEDAFRQDRVISRWFGELLVPSAGGQLQHVKCGTPPDDALVREDIAAGVLERREDDALLLVGTGTTPKAVLDSLHLRGSLLGVDAVLGSELLARDLDAPGISRLLDTHARCSLVVTATGGQGFLFGRGNQQLTADIIRRIGIANIVIVATPGKLAALGGRSLLVDTGDRELDRQLSGLRTIWTGYSTRVLYRVVAAGELNIA